MARAMIPWRDLPLGVDLGSARVCVAHVQHNGESIRLVCAASQPTQTGMEAKAAALRSAWQQLGSRSRRCVVALRRPEGSVAVRTFPAMRLAERRSALRFEVERTHGSQAVSAMVARVRTLDREAGTYAVGIAARAAIDAARACVGRAGLTVAAIDLDAYALRRALPHAGIVVDVGLHRSAVHRMTGLDVESVEVPIGGSAVTDAIAADLGLSRRFAEDRKVAVGSAGAALGATRECVQAIGAAVRHWAGLTPAPSVAFVGNGSRPPGLRAKILQESGTQACDKATVWTHEAYPDDVARTLLPDWALAVGLATWGVGA